MTYEVVSRETFKNSRNKFVIKYMVKVGELTYEAAHQLDQKKWEKFSPEEQDDFFLSRIKKHHENHPQISVEKGGEQ